MQCWQLKPLEGTAGTVTVKRTISLPSPIVSYHFGAAGNSDHTGSIRALFIAG